MRLLPRVALAAAAAAFVLGPASLDGQEPDLPYLSGRVVDEAGLLSDATRTELERHLESFETETGTQLVVVTVPDLEGRPIEDYSIRLAEAWQIGREGVDDGVIFLIAPSERRMRIEVGYGLEGALTDAESRRILDRVVTPRYRSGDFDGGTLAGVRAIIAQVRGEAPPPAAESPRQRYEDWAWLLELLPILLFLAVYLFVAYARFRGRRTRSWSSRSGPGWIVLPGPGDDDDWFGGFGRGGFGGGGFGGGVGGGGGFSGGGGSFGGGGASGGW